MSWRELRGRKDKCDWSGNKKSQGKKKGRQLLPALVLGSKVLHTETLGLGGKDRRRMGKDSKCIRWMPTPETSPWELLPATVPAVKGDDSILVRRPFDAWGNKGWFFHWLVSLVQSPWNAMTPREGRCRPVQQGLEHPVNGGNRQERGQLDGGTLTTHTLQIQSWGDFHSRTPICCAQDSFAN